MSRHPQSGFSLVELVIAIVIMSLMLTGIFTLYGRGQSAVRRSDIQTTATFLARTKMAEVVIDLERRMAEKKFPQTDEKETGEFEGEYANYRFEVSIARIKMPQLPGDLGGGEGGASGGAASGPMQLIMQQLKLDDYIREVTLKVLWDERGRERSIQVVTHVVKLS